jgi:hypothetical protein
MTPVGAGVIPMSSGFSYRAPMNERHARSNRELTLLIVLGLPAFAAIVGWPFAGREPAALTHQGFQ